jgi:hypothetical protein
VAHRAGVSGDGLEEGEVKNWLALATCAALLFTTPIQIENTDDCPALVVHQSGNSTAAVIQSDTDNPALRLVAHGNAAALELAQTDGEDCVDGSQCDARFRQLIGLWRVCVGANGALQFADPNEPTEYYDAMRLGPAEEIMLGNPERGNSVRLRVPAYGYIDFEVGDQLMMRVQADGIRIRPGTIREDL